VECHAETGPHFRIKAFVFNARAPGVRLQSRASPERSISFDVVPIASYCQMEFEAWAPRRVFHAQVPHQPVKVVDVNPK
jgi:hypothetical protein